MDSGGGFSIIANEVGVFDKDAIERQLAHRERNKVRAAYHRSEYLEERKRIMTWWGAWLEAIVPKKITFPQRYPLRGKFLYFRIY